MRPTQWIAAIATATVLVTGCTGDREPATEEDYARFREQMSSSFLVRSGNGPTISNAEIDCFADTLGVSVRQLADLDPDPEDQDEALGKMYRCFDDETVRSIFAGTLEMVSLDAQGFDSRCALELMMTEYAEWKATDEPMSAMMSDSPTGYHAFAPCAYPGVLD